MKIQEPGIPCWDETYWYSTSLYTGMRGEWQNCLGIWIRKYDRGCTHETSFEAQASGIGHKNGIMSFHGNTTLSPTWNINVRSSKSGSVGLFRATFRQWVMRRPLVAAVGAAIGAVIGTAIGTAISAAIGVAIGNGKWMWFLKVYIAPVVLIGNQAVFSCKINSSVASPHFWCAWPLPGGTACLQSY